MRVDSDHSWRHRPGSPRVVLYVSAGALLGGAILYRWNQVELKSWLDWAFVHCYMNDCLAGVTLVSYANLLCLGARREDLCLTTPSRIAILMLCVGLFWEFVTPLYRTDSIRDPLDLLAYVAGGIIYWAILRGTERVKCSHGT